MRPDLRLRQVKQRNTPEGRQTEAVYEPAGVKVRRVRKGGDVHAVQQKLWQAVLAAEDLLLHEDASTELQLKAVHALVQACAAYGRLLETSELAERLTNLENALAQRRGQSTRAYA